jgi:hypothetical protein
MLNEEITLQINISPGDIKYAELVIPELIKKHSKIREKLLIVDCNRPQKTKLVNPDIKFPIKVFKERVKRLLEIVEIFKQANFFTNIIILDSTQQDLYNKLAKKYLRNLYNCTHSAGATANMSYWAGFEFVKTRFILHYDGDMLLYQNKDYDWAVEGIEILKKNDDIISVVPPLAPTTHQLEKMNKSGTLFSTDNWFSTRIFLIDKTKFDRELPLIKKGIYLELILRKYLKRAFPRDPEIILFKSLGYKKYKRAKLKTDQAWTLHPTDKPDTFIKNLPKIISEINHNSFPKEQIDQEDIIIDKWVEWI